MPSQLLLAALAAAVCVSGAADTRTSLDLEKRQTVATQTITDVDTTVGANVLGTTTVATSGSVLSWSAVSASIFAPSASLATTTAPPVSPKPTPTANIRIAAAAAPQAACAPVYQAKTTLNGAVGTLPRPSTFITRGKNGVQLLQNGKTFRPVGPNIYWLGLDENVQPSPSYPDQGRVREVIAAAAAMGANTVRLFSARSFHLLTRATRFGAEPAVSASVIRCPSGRRSTVRRTRPPSPQSTMPSQLLAIMASD